MKQLFLFFAAIAIAGGAHGSTTMNHSWPEDGSPEIQKNSPTSTKSGWSGNERKAEPQKKEDKREKPDSRDSKGNRKPCVDPKPDREPTVLY